MVPHESRGITRNDVQASTRPSFLPPARADKGVGHARLDSSLGEFYIEANIPTLSHHEIN